MTKTGCTPIGKLVLAVCLWATAPSVLAETYEFSGTITTCTGTCESFAALSLGSIVTGTIDINTTPNGSWSFGDIGEFNYSIFNPGDPPGENPGPDPTIINPLPLIAAIAPIRAAVAAPNVGGIAPTGGTTDALNALSGTILHEFIVPPFNSNGAWAIFNIGPGGATTINVCLFAPTAGCIPGATLAVIVTGAFSVVVPPSDISVEPDLVENGVDFGNLQIDTPASVDITVTNDGEGELIIDSVDISGLPTQFTVNDSDCTGAPVPTDQTCIISIDVQSDMPNLLEGDIGIVSNDPDPDENPLSLAVRANIVAGSIMLSDNLTDNTLAFDLIENGGMAESTITVSNVGEGTLAIGDVAVANPLVAPFSITTNTCLNMTLESQEPPVTCDITVMFQPEMVAEFMDSFEISSDDPAYQELDLEVFVTGEATAAAEPRILVEPAGPVDFGDLLLGETAEQAFIVRNNGSSVLTIGDIFVVGADMDYVPSDNCSTLEPGEPTCTIDVVFTANAAGERNAVLTIESDAINDTELTIDLTASVFAGPRIELSTTELEFGSTGQPVDIGTTESATLTVSSTGTEALVVSGTSFSGTHSDQFVVNDDETTCSAGAVEPGLTCIITVDFSPTDTGDKIATLSVESTDVNSPSEVSLTGFVFEGARAEVSTSEVMVTAVDDDAVIIGESAEASFMLLSTGTDPLTVSQIEITEDNTVLEQFDYTTDCFDMSPVPSGEACNVTVIFEPSAVGTQTATMTISTSAVAVRFTRGAVTDIVVALSGVGEAPPFVPPGPLPASQTVPPPAFALADPGGGALGVGLLGLGLILLVVRRRYR